MKFQKSNPEIKKPAFFYKINSGLLNTLACFIFSFSLQGCQAHKKIISKSISSDLKIELVESDEHRKQLEDFRYTILGIKPLSEEKLEFSGEANIEILRLYHLPSFHPEIVYTIYLSEGKSWIETRYSNVSLRSIYLSFQLGLNWREKVEIAQLFIEVCPLNYSKLKSKIKNINLYNFPGDSGIGERPFVTDGDLYYHFSLNRGKYHQFVFSEPQKGLSKYDDLFLELIGTYFKARKCRL